MKRRRFLKCGGSLTGPLLFSSLSGCLGADGGFTYSQKDGQTGNKTDATVEWPMFGYDHENTSYVSHGGPTENPSVEWAFGEVEGPVRSSPAVVDGTVYLGDRDGVMYAVDAETGKKLWSFAVHEEGEVEGDWLPYMDTQIDSSVCVTEGKVVFGAWNGYVYALDAKEGKEVWRFWAGDILRSSPVPDGDVLYIGDWSGRMYALSTEDGEVVWEYDTGNDHIRSTPCLDAEGILYFGAADTEEGGRGYTPDGGDFHAVDTETGESEWVFDTEGGVVSSPAFGGGSVYFGDLENHVYALDRRGEEEWLSEVRDRVNSSPALDGESVYVCNEDDALQSFDTETGELLWEFDTGYEPYGSMITVTDETVYLRSEFVDSERGGLLNRIERDVSVRSMPAIVEGELYVVGKEGIIKIT